MDDNTADIIAMLIVFGFLAFVLWLACRDGE